MNDLFTTAGEKKDFPRRRPPPGIDRRQLSFCDLCDGGEVRGAREGSPIEGSCFSFFLSSLSACPSQLTLSRRTTSPPTRFQTSVTLQEKVPQNLEKIRKRENLLKLLRSLGVLHVNKARHSDKHYVESQ